MPDYNKINEAINSKFGIEYADNVCRAILSDEEYYLITPVYTTPMGYANPKYWFSTAYLHEVNKKNKSENKNILFEDMKQENERAFTATYEELINSPSLLDSIFFLDKEFVEAIDFIEDNGDVDIETIEWKHNAMLFMLPSSADISFNTEYIKGELCSSPNSVLMISLCLIKKDKIELQEDETGNIDSKFQNTAICVITMIDSNGKVATVDVPFNGTLKSRINEIKKELGNMHDKTGLRMITESARMAYRLITILASNLVYYSHNQEDYYNDYINYEGVMPNFVYLKPAQDL